MNTYTIESFFENYKELIPSVIEKGRILRLGYNEENGTFTCQAAFDKLVPFDSTVEFEMKMRAALGAGKFILQLKYTPDMLCAEYFPELCKFLKSRFPLVNGFFDNAEAVYENGIFTVDIKHGGEALLKKAGIETAFPALTMELFSVRADIRLTGVLETDMEEHQREQEEFLNSLPVPKIDPAQPEKKAAVTTNTASGASVDFRTANVDFTRFSLLCDDSLVLMGAPISGNEQVMQMKDIPADYRGRVVVWGDIFGPVETKETKSGMLIAHLNFTDYTSSNSIKFIGSNKNFRNMKGLKRAVLEAMLEHLKAGKTILVAGEIEEDDFDHSINIKPDSIMVVKREKEKDTCEYKRVELHCHTNMSMMDALTPAGKLVERAYSWGHKALAITDHGVVQGYPDAGNTCIGIRKGGGDFKVLYGIESYEVNNDEKIFRGTDKRELTDEIICFDLETTGTNPNEDRIIEIGAVKLRDLEVVDKLDIFVNPERPIPEFISNLTHITDDMVKDGASEREALLKFKEFIGDDPVLVAHNSQFDTGFISACAKRQGIEIKYSSIDTVPMSQIMLPELEKHKLNYVAEHFGLGDFQHHRGCDDAEVLAGIFIRLSKMLMEQYPLLLITVDMINSLLANENQVLAKPTYHQIIIVRNNTGLKNLYRLISDSNLKYFKRRPRIPKSELVRHREGLILGSACERGEVIQAYLEGRNYEEIKQIASFYDYLEIQPDGNNKFMLTTEKPPYDRIHTAEDIKDINRFIVKLGEDLGIPVCATGDVHFMDKTDAQFRSVIQASMGFPDADTQPPLYLKTTNQMLDELSYLGEEKAFEVVVTNTNNVADMVDPDLKAFPNGTYTPFIEGSVYQLQYICWKKCCSIYGDCDPETIEVPEGEDVDVSKYFEGHIPDLVFKRLKRELDSIIKHGFAVLYMISQKLVANSNENGYQVGSRGSVGSSFVATMSGITEVNPLQAHYRCAYCKYSDFDSPEVKAFSGRSGCDMPDKICPVCGKKLVKDGFDIPFETFLGFKGNKEPDIDLNFSGEYQSKAHAYCEVIFGYGQTFRAGTIGTLADKTAFGYIKNYYEERGVHKRNCEIDRIVQGCVGVRRTTGQHPGGIVVLPVGEEINTFTPVQHPANDMTTATVTTHFDYHSIDHNLLKLDILGHDDPTMIRMLQDLTGIDPTTIPLDDESVMSLFKNTSALGVTPDDIHGIPLGCLGIPEFGTDFAMQMVIDAKPQEFSDLIRISGLSHGTDVWLGNAQTLIEQGLATISTAICTRDDIMIYLIQRGLDSEQSFTIMESVRKGKGLKEEWKTEMRAHDVPEWYIDSCLKIKYMFPKAHAAAYVMMAWRIAYCKVYYPLAYYAAYFSIRATGFNYEIMCQGKERLEYFYKDYTRRKDSLSKKEQDTYRDMKIVQEMYARGFDFTPIDVYRAKPDRFQVIDGKLMPALNTIDGMGDNAAIAVAEAAKDGKFLSKDDFRQRTKATKTVIDLMADLGLLGELPESNQLSLFDFA